MNTPIMRMVYRSTLNWIWFTFHFLSSNQEQTLLHSFSDPTAYGVILCVEDNFEIDGRTLYLSHCESFCLDMTFVIWRIDSKIESRMRIDSSCSPVCVWIPRLSPVLTK